MRHCPICGGEMSHHRVDAFVCGPSCRAELSRIKRLLSGQPVDRRESLADHLESRRKRTQPPLETV